MAHDRGVLDTSIIAALRLYDPAELPDTFLITAVTLGELSYGPHATDDPFKRAARVAVLQPAHATPRRSHVRPAPLRSRRSQALRADMRGGPRHGTPAPHPRL